MGRARIVWKKGKNGGNWTRQFGPGSCWGGTCAYERSVLIYSEPPGEIRIAHGEVRFKNKYAVDFVALCPLDDVAAVFDENGRRIYPLKPADG